MRVEEIRNAQHAQPFRPFTMHLADGRQFLINHPEFLFVGPVGRVAIVQDVAGNIEIIDPLMVTSLSMASGQTASSS